MNLLENNIISLYGDAGKHWLISLPRLIKELEVVYGLSELIPVANLSYNYVLSGFRGSQAVILKLGPDIDGLQREAAALKAFSGLGVVNLLFENEGMLLLEQAISGASLKSYFPDKDREAIDHTCACLKRLHQAPIPLNHQFPHLKDWLSILDEDINIPINYLRQARQLRDDLLATSPLDVLLHGDLHHDNILRHGKGWIVIDPKGVIGEPTYEVTSFIRNPIPELLVSNDMASIISFRLARFAKILNLSQQRIQDWCFVQAVLSWSWTLADGGDDSYFKRLLQVLTGK